MAQATYDDFGDEGSAGSWLRYAIVIAVGVGIAALVWHFVSDKSGIRKEAPRVTTLVAILPPPPPPPPPPKERPPEAKPLETPKPVETPHMDAPKPMTMNADAQAGTDAFNIGAGDGTGQLGNGSGFSEATYSRYMSSQLQDAAARDDRINRLTFAADLAIWVDERGKLTRARLLRTTGDPKIDEALIQDYEGTAFDQPPPSSLRFPQKITVRSRRPT